MAEPGPNTGAKGGETTARDGLCKPRPVLRIAVIGHTTLEAPGEVGRQVAAAVEAVVGAASGRFEQAKGLYADGEAPEYRLVCGLAPGTDQMAAECAAKYGLGVTYVLPDEPGLYAARLAREGGEFARAAERIPEFLEGKQVLGVVYAKRAPGYNERAADLWAARKTIEHAEVLIAVWNGADREGVTFAAMREAARRGVSVVWINGAKAAERGAGSQAAPAFGDDAGNIIEWRDTEEARMPVIIADAIRAVIDPYWDLTYQQQGWLRESWKFVLETVRKPDVFARGAGKREKEAEESKEQQIKLLTWSLEGKRTGWLALGRLWHQWIEGPHKQRAHRRLYRESEFRDPDQQPDGPPRGEPAMQERIERRHEWLEKTLPNADRVAWELMGGYRLAFVATFLLGAAAVFMAVAAFLLKIDCLSLWREPAISAKVGLVVAVAELVVVLVILAIFLRSNTAALHVRAVDYRRLAELFRHARALLLVGAVVPPADSHAREKGAPVEWFEWYFRAVMRGVDFGLERGERLGLGTEYLAAARHHLAERWIRDQREYHRLTWRRYKLLEHGFHRWTVVLFLVVVLAVSMGIAAAVSAKEGLPWPHGEWIAAVVVIIAAGFPALAGALHGIASQGEFERLGHSYRHMEHYLAGVITMMRNIRDPNSPEAVEEVAQHAAEQMLREVEDWHRTYRHHTAVQLT